MARIVKTSDGATHSFGESVKDHALLAKGAEAQELETRSKPLDDFGGSGEAIVLRQFSFQLPPKVQFSKKEILAHHMTRIPAFLWKDGLEQIGEPKLIMGKKGQFHIFITAKARRGVILNERPLSLKEAITQNAKPAA